MPIRLRILFVIFLLFILSLLVPVNADPVPSSELTKETALSSVGGESAETATLEEAVLGAPALKKGDYGTLIKGWLDIVKKNPDEPVVEFIFRSLPYFRSYLPDQSVMTKQLEEILAGEMKNGFNRILLMEYLMGLYQMQGQWDKSQSLLDQLGFVSDWSFNGPWGFTSLASFDEVYPPETDRADLSLEKPYEVDSRLAGSGSGPDRPWRAYPTQFQDMGINFFNYLAAPKGAVYGLAQIKSPAPQEIIIRINTGSAFKCWLNDQAVFEVDRLRKYWPVELDLKCNLRAGWNRLMIKLISGLGRTFSVQLLDRQGQPLKDLEFESALKLHPLEKNETKVNPVVARPTGALEFYLERAKNNPDDPFILSLLGLLHLFVGHDDEALFFAEKAVSVNPDLVWSHYTLTRVYGSTTLLPETHRRNLVKKEYEQMLKIDPDFVPAYQGRAIYYNEDDKTEKALRELEKAFKVNPDFFYGYYLTAKFSERQNWSRETERCMKKLDELVPDNSFYLSYWIRRHLDGQNYQKALELFRKKLPVDYSVAWQIAGLHRKQGYLENTLKIYNEFLKKDPNSVSYLEAVAELQVEMEDYPAAIKNYRRLLSLVPGSARYYQVLGDLYLKSGDEKKASENYHTSLKFRPANITLRRYLEFLDNRKGDFYQPFAVDVKTLIPGAPDKTKYPKSAVVYLLDQAVVRIYEDGAHSDVIHQAYKILNDEGIDKYSTINIQGELLEAKIHQPDGTVLEPTRVSGSSFTMPVVQIGSVIEYKFKIEAPYASQPQFIYPAFYFQDPNFDSPFLISQLIVITPKNFDLKYIQKNLTLKPEVKEQSDVKIYNWTMTHTERIEPESFMPHHDDILPHVIVGQYLDWSEINKFYKEYFFQRALVTRAIKEKAQLLIKGQETVLAKTEAIYYFVTDLIKDTGGSGYTAHDIILEKKGNRLILMKALLDAAGVESHFALTRQNHHLYPEPNWSFPDPDYFAGEGSGGPLLQIVQESGEALWLSGSYRYLPCGLIPFHFQEGFSFVIGKNSGRMVKIPKLPAEENLSYSEFTFYLDEKNKVSAVGHIMVKGESAATTKESLTPLDKQSRKNILESSFNSLYPGLTVKEIDFAGLQKSTEPLKINVQFSWSDFSTQGQDGISCKTGLVPLNLTRQFISESDRKLPLEVKRNSLGREKIKIVLPLGWRLKNAPENVNLASKFGTYSLTISSQVVSRDDLPVEVISISKNYFVWPQKILPVDYPEFIKFCRQVDNIEKRKLSLGEKE